MIPFIEKLQAYAGAEVHFDAIHKRAYSVDASIYEIEPIGIAIPKTKEALIQLVKIARDYGIPVIARGAGTGITGGCIGKGLIIDTSKYLNKILSINYEEEYAICEPGVVQDSLNQALAAQGYRLGPDTSTGDRATIGGMLANNSAGARSLYYGEMVDHVEAVELVLASGEVLRFQPVDEAVWEKKREQKDAEGRIYREVFRICEEYRQDIEKHFPKIPRRVSGYNLDKLLKPGPLNICQLIAGSEGSLGIATEIKVRICKKPKLTGICIVHFEDMVQGMHTIHDMLLHDPIALEMIDNKIIEMARLSPAVKNKLGWLSGHPRMVFVAEFAGNSLEEVAQKLTLFEADMKKKGIGYALISLTDPIQMNYVWEVRKSGLGLLLSKRTYSRAIAFIEDLSIGPAQLPSFMEKFQDYLKSLDKDAGIYGHVGPGCMHVRPYIDLRKKEELYVMEKMMEDVSDLILQHGGAMSGEHGDGLIRSWLNKKMFGERVYQAFVELKAAFDPDNRMNPGKVVHGQPLLENLRLNPDTKQVNISTFLDFSRQGGFELSADLCNGNGLCRKKTGTMCPSFQASGDEYDTTRARAQALRGVIHGQISLNGFANEEVYDVLDLCLECKGCKTECPSQVDMAKMKAEFLYHYQKKHGYSLRSRLFGHIGHINELASPFAGLFNRLVSSRLSKRLLNWIGISPQRPFPALARERFSQWMSTQAVQDSGRGEVVLYNDTYNEFNVPEIGQAACKVLNALGYKVIVPPWKCCGRPLISKGLLEEAKDKAIKVIQTLYPYAERGLKIVGLEPSCILTLKDDFEDLLQKHWPEGIEKAAVVVKACMTFDEFLHSHLEKGQLPLFFKAAGAKSAFTWSLPS